MLRVESNETMMKRLKATSTDITQHKGVVSASVLLMGALSQKLYLLVSRTLAALGISDERC